MSIIKKAKISADKRSIDAYGRSIELAIAGYLLDNGKFPTEVSQLTIEYSGNKVECETTQINTDSSVYLAGCTVGGRSVDGYTYGNEETITYETYATMAYYSAEDCVSAGDVSGCITDYDVSDIKQVIDLWKANYASESEQAKLIKLEELSSLGYTVGEYTPSDIGMIPTEITPNWLYDISRTYWTNSSGNDENSVWIVFAGKGKVFYINVGSKGIAVRPVITISKSVLN